jgi:ABC-2 type transport system permease protein
VSAVTATNISLAPLTRIAALAWSDIRLAWRRPLPIVLLAIMALSSFGLVAGGLTISTGSADTAGTKAWINSEFNIGFVDVLLLSLIAPFFASVACGNAITTDEERKLDRILHATPLSPLEYALGRFLGALMPVLLALVAWKTIQIGLYELYPVADPEKVRGPFSIVAYLRPTLLLSMPLLILMAGVAFLLGTLTRQAALVFAMPTLLFLLGVFFVWGFSPEWLPEWINVGLQWIDPAGMRWLGENYLNEDRGAAFYNTAGIALDPAFAVSRVILVAIGVASIGLTASIVARRVRGRSPAIALDAIPRASATQDSSGVTARAPLPACSQAEPGLVGTTLAVFRKEVRWLVRSPGLFIFGQLILVEFVGSSLVRTGPLDTLVLHSSGTLAAGAFNTLTLLLVLLVLYYSVESLTREERHNTARIVRATAAPTLALLTGKVLANAVMAIVIVAAAFLAAIIILLVQGLATPIEPAVFLLIWGALLAPTLILWSAFVTFLQALLRNRYATYVVALGVLILTGFLTQFGYLNWAGRWHLWGGVLWSDLDRLDLRGAEVLWNRIAALTLAGFFIVMALRIWPRRTGDARAIADRMRPGRLLRASLVPAIALAPTVAILCGMLVAMRAGASGGPAERRAKDYWRQNSATWEDAPVPSLESVRAEVDLRPSTRSIEVRAELVLANRSDDAMEAMPITVRDHLTAKNWTLNGVALEPTERWDGQTRPSIEDRSGLYLLRTAEPVAPGESIRVGFELTGELPFGWSKRPSGEGEFVLPSGVVLTSFTGSFLPVVGFLEGVGIDEKNSRETREFGAYHWKERVDPLFGPAWSTRLELTVTGPADWTINCVGVPGEETIDGARKTTRWSSDHPVRFFNLVGGPLREKRGESTQVFYNERHAKNVERMSTTLDAARKHYGEWFHPYPWRDLKLTEFPGLATYAQGFPGNITFSESIGFLTKDAGEEEADVVTFVVAHEAAHQWWGNILTPGKGPGGNVLSEGMANFSAAMLVREIESEAKCRSLLRKFEDTYANSRSPDNERALHKVDGSRPGDTTVTYDRGGWVFWMMKEEVLGEERMLAGLRAFIEAFKDGPDYPLIEDFVESMRPFAPDAAAYQRFVDQWVYGTVVPQFELTEIAYEPSAEAADGRRSGTVRGVLHNRGTGTVQVMVAALQEAGNPAGNRATTTVAIAAGESVPFTIDCGFPPREVVVDPDVRILQLGRKRAVQSIDQ